MRLYRQDGAAYQPGGAGDLISDIAGVRASYTSETLVPSESLWAVDGNTKFRRMRFDTGEPPKACYWSIGATCMTTISRRIRKNRIGGALMP
jgi:hypothetical protein